MSIETQELINGVWVTRRIDVQTAIDQNIRASSGSSAQAKAPPGQSKVAPSMGILTRTIIGSPITRWILPGRIRDKDKNDVVFIGETSILIKEVQSDGCLQEIASKTLSDARIRHARVFGVPTEPAFSYNAEVKVEDVEAMPVSDSNPSLPGPSEKMEPHGKAEMTVPPQILVLSLDTGSLLFVFAYETADGAVQFTATSKALPSRLSALEEPGKRIAVDPKSRALAVAASRELFVLYALHPASTFQDAVEAEGSVKPNGLNFVREERTFAVDGDIIQMEFLYPSPGDERYVILLLMVSKDQKTRFLVYEWDSSVSVHTAEQQGAHGLRVGDHDKQPSLLIPLTISSAFLLVSESTISAYTGILTGVVQRIFVGRIFNDPVFARSRDSKTPACTAWARPVRFKGYSSRRDDMYIFREDGMLRLIEIDEADQLLLKTSSPVGKIHGFVGTAFACLDLGVGVKYDMVIAGGHMGPGGVYLISPKKDSVDCVEAIPNWTPASDFIITTPNPLQPGSEKSSSMEVYRRSRIFTCGSRLEYGAVTELRHGMKSWIKTILPYKLGADRLWGFHHPYRDPNDLDPNKIRIRTFLVISFPLHTEVIRISDDMQEIHQLSEADTPGLNLGARTLAAGKFESTIVQVTRRCILTMNLPPLDGPTPVEEASWALPADESIVEACLQPDSAHLITAVRKQDQVLLGLTSIRIEDSRIIFRQVGEPLNLLSELSHLSTIQFGAKSYVIVGTTESTIQIFRIDLQQGLSPILEHSFHDNDFNIEFAICEGVAVLEPCDANENAAAQQLFLICGLRNGFVAVLKLSLSASSDHYLSAANDITVVSQRAFRLGIAPCVAIPDHFTADSAFLISGDVLHRVRARDLEGDIQLSNLWLTDPHEHAYSPNSVRVLTRIPPQGQRLRPGLDRLMACLNLDQIIMFLIDDMPKTVPHHMKIYATPRKMVYSQHLEKLVVATSIRRNAFNTLESRDPNNRHDPIMELALIDPDSGLVSKPHEYESKHSIPALGIVERGEEILVMIGWLCTLAGNNKYHYIVLGTGITSRRPASRTGGRILLIAVTETLHRVIFKHVLAISCSDPVYSLASYGSCSLVSSAGAEICIRRYNEQENKLARIGEFVLRSPGIHLTVDDPLIYVSTASDSLTVLRYQESELVQVFSDGAARLSETHLTLPGHSLTLVSDKECCVMGLWQDREDLTSCSGRSNSSGSLGHQELASGETVFEAELPVTIMRFHIGDVQPTWRPCEATPGEIPPGGPNAEMTVGKKTSEILGFGQDGSLYRFTLLSDAAWRLLRFIQNLAFRSSKIHAFSQSRPSQTHLEPRDGAPHLKHVDGDILASVVGLGSGFVRELLEAEPVSARPGRAPVDFATAEARRERFRVLVMRLLGESREDPVEASMNYLRAVLKSGFSTDSA